MSTIDLAASRQLPLTKLLVSNGRLTAAVLISPADNANPHALSAGALSFAHRVTVDPSGCWLWQGARNSTGYGSIGIGGRTYLTHRVAYEQMVGPIPPGLTIDHLCQVKTCCNPTHLEAVSRGENLRRRFTRTDVCPNGHPYTGATHPTRGHRLCRECHRAHNRAYRARIGGNK